MIGCASGVSDPVVMEVETNNVSPPSPRQPQVYPPQKEGIEPNVANKECKVTQTLYVNNCVIKVLRCNDGTIDFDSYCLGPPYVPDWIWYPDPPIPEKERNYNE